VPAVSDSSPLIVFAKIGRLLLLRDVFGEVLAPPSVYAEVVGAGGGRPGEAEVRAAAWIRATALGRAELADALATELGRGEAEVIALAVELGRRVPVLIDDRYGRRVARRHRLRVFGSAGVLVLAKDAGWIPAVRPVLDDLRSAGLFLGEHAYHDTLAQAREL
jgi:uncharacterized protein